MSVSGQTRMSVLLGGRRWDGSHRERRHWRADATMLGEDVGLDVAVLHADGPLGPMAELRVVRDQHDGHPLLAVQVGEEIENPLGRHRVEIARRLVGQRAIGSLASERAMATRWRSPTESFCGM